MTFRKKPFTVAFSFAVATLATACTPEAASEGPTNSAKVFALPDAQLKELSAKASHGDCPAAQRVADYYSFSLGDIKGAIPWMRLAASACAESSAKANLVTILLMIDPHNPEIDELTAKLEAVDPVWAGDLRTETGIRRKTHPSTDSRGADH